MTVIKEILLSGGGARALQFRETVSAVHDNCGAGHQLDGIGGKQNQRAVQLMQFTGAPLRDAPDERLARR